MLSTLPHSVGFSQPHSVEVDGYRIRMGNTAKSTLVENLLALLRARAGNPALEASQAITALVKLGVATGNAQRLLDAQSDIRLGTVAAAAERLKVRLPDLLTTTPPVDQPQPPSLADALERIGIELAKEMPDDVRDDVADTLAKLARRMGAERHQAELLTLLQAPHRKQPSAA